MPAKVLVDIPGLSERIRAIVKTYKKSNEPKKREGQDLVRGLIRDLIVRAITEEKSYWDSVGLRMVSYSEFAKCHEKVSKNAKVLGEGAFGKFISVSADPCIKGLPKGLERVGIKMEYIKEYYSPSQSAAGVSNAAKIARKAATLEIGPQLYDIFIAKDAKGKVMIVKVSEIIDGKTWADTEWESPEKKHAAAKQLQESVNKMNEAGIIHHDLHSGNVMVSNSGKVYIIDYDLAKFVQDEEKGQLYNFNNTFESEYNPSGPTSDDGVQYVYDKLIEEGSIKLVSSNNGNSNGKNNNKNKSKKKTRKNNA